MLSMRVYYLYYCNIVTLVADCYKRISIEISLNMMGTMIMNSFDTKWIHSSWYGLTLSLERRRQRC